MKLIFSFLCCVQATCLFANSSSHCLRAILVGDTLTSYTKFGIEKDISNMERSITVISRIIDAQLDLTILVGKAFTIENIRKWFLTLPHHSEDIIFFYYSGHGLKDGLSSPWPVLQVCHDGLLGGRAIVECIRNNNSRLSIVLFDCCNCGPGDANHVTYVEKEPIYLQENYHLPGLKTLFLRTRGLIVACSASPGQISGMYNSGPSIGSIFTRQLCLAWKKCCKEKHITWTRVLQKADRLSIRESHSCDVQQNVVQLVLEK